MTTSRKILILAVIAVGAVLVVVGLALTSPVQTWAIRKVAASRPEVTLSLERVSLGWRQIEVKATRVDYEGAVLTLPHLEAELALWPAAWQQDVKVTKLVARGWTLDLRKYRPAQMAKALGPVQYSSFSLLSTAHAAQSQPSAETVFAGVLSQIQLPVNLSLDGVVLEGNVILFSGSDNIPVTIDVTLVGGNFAAGKEGLFDITASLQSGGSDAQVQGIDVRGTLKAVMDTPRTFTNLRSTVNAQARGKTFPEGVQLTVQADAARVKGGENYNFTVQSVGKRLVDVQANYPDNSERLGGVWRLDVRDTDIAPFMLGYPVPTFAAVGAGMFEADTGFAEIHGAGRINASANRLEVFAPELRELGSLKVFAEFDLVHRGDVSRINTFSLEATQDEPVLKLAAIQTFEINTATGELKVADPESDLIEVNLLGLPVAWVAPLVSSHRLSGDRISGKFTASARDGGVRAEMIESLVVGNLALRENDGQLLLQGLNLRSDFTAEYTARGWQAEVTSVEVNAGGGKLLSLSMKAGQSSGIHDPIIGTGHAEIDLSALLNQALAEGVAHLQRGDLQLDFSGSWAEARDLQVKLSLNNLLTEDNHQLPSIAANLRAQIDASGQTRFNLPITCTRESRISDLILQGTLAPEKEGLRVVAKLSGREVWLDDLELLSALVAGTTVATQNEITFNGRDERPFWTGVSGEIEMALQILHYIEEFEMRGVSGMIKISNQGMILETLRAGLGDESALNLQGKVDFDPASAEPYTLAADMTMNDFVSGPLFRALSPGNLPQVDGVFNAKSQIYSTGQNAVDLMRRTQGDLHLKSAGGVFRILPPQTAVKVENAGKIAALGAFIGNVMGGKDSQAFASKAQAVVELSKILTAINYDQLNVSVHRLENYNTVLDDFSLISPEVRLTGGGKITARKGVGFFQQPLNLALEMKVRGKTGEAFDFLGVLAEEKDSLGYAVCLLPLKIKGSLARPDTRELETAFRKLAMERTGADDLLQRLLGK